MTPPFHKYLNSRIITDVKYPNLTYKGLLIDWNDYDIVSIKFILCPINASKFNNELQEQIKRMNDTEVEFSVQEDLIESKAVIMFNISLFKYKTYGGRINYILKLLNNYLEWLLGEISV